MLSLARLLVCPTSLTIVVGLHLSGFGLAWCKSILMRVQNPKQYTFYRLFVCFSGVPFSLKLSCRVPLTKKFGKRCARSKSKVKEHNRPQIASINSLISRIPSKQPMNAIAKYCF